jgi:uncharacterized Zn finger protein (UPF0148 family)
MENEVKTNWTIICPCCEAKLTVDAATGAILSHEEKGKKHGSFEELQKNLAAQKEARENIFAQEMNREKERERLLEEKFRDAFKRAEGEPDTPFRNPLELD